MAFFFFSLNRAAKISLAFQQDTRQIGKPSQAWMMWQSNSPPGAKCWVGQVRETESESRRWAGAVLSAWKHLTSKPPCSKNKVQLLRCVWTVEWEGLCLCLDTERFPPLRRQRESAQLWKQQSTELESIFPDVLLVWKELSCPSVYLNQMWCDPVSGLTAPPRGSSQTCRNIWPPRPPEAASSPPSFSSSSTPLLSLFFFFFVSSNYKHMSTVSTSCCQAKGLCCFSLWAQHFGTLGQFWALKGASAPELVLLRGPQQAGKCDLALEKIKEPVLYCL